VTNLAIIAVRAVMLLTAVAVASLVYTAVLIFLTFTS
jgi:hypothetical protein